MVTWGANTVHNIGTGGSTTTTNSSASFSSAPPTTSTTGGLFGTTTAAPTPGGFSFASSTNPTTPPAPSLSSSSSAATTTASTSTGGLFGGVNPVTNTAAAPTGGFFGSSTAPASSPGGLFGSSSFFGGTPAPSSGGLFGNSSINGGTSSLFGGSTSTFGSTSNTTGGIFGSPAPTLQQQQPQQPQIPAHAALQAHMNAYARNEEARVLQRMQTLYQTYAGTSIATDEKSHCFSIPLYNPITEQQRQLQDAVSTIVMSTNNQGFLVSSALVAPPRPAQICEEDWKLACIRNPDANHFIPTAVVGANNLLARAMLHQEQCNTIQKHMVKIQEAIDHILQRHGEITRLLETTTEYHQKQCTRLLKIMKAVEVGRCFNISLQSAELEAFQQIRHLKYSIIEAQLVPEVLQLTDPQRPHNNGESKQSETALSLAKNITIPMEKQKIWMTILTEHRHQMSVTTKALQTEQQDLQLLHDRVIGNGSTSKSNHTIALLK